jgi:hypothetical protein
MRSFFVIAALFAVVSVQAQTTPAENDMDAVIARRLMQQPTGQTLLGFQPQKPNEIRINGIVYSGIAVQLATTDNPLELINPLAPPEYGSSEDNTVYDPVTGRASGLKLFSIQF